MVGAGPVVFAVWGYCIAKADRAGVVILNPALLAPIIGTSRREIEQAIEYLESPDERSKNPDHEGRRLVNMSGFAYSVVSHAIYRNIKTSGERNEYMREYMRKRRGGGGVNMLTQLTKVNPVSVSVSDSVSEEERVQGKGRKFIPPSVEEVAAYCAERKNSVNAENFVDFYTAKGWMVGKNKVKDWKACVRTWEHGDKARRVERNAKASGYYDSGEAEPWPDDYGATGATGAKG